MLRRQHVYCQDENNAKLKAGYNDGAKLLKQLPSDPPSVARKAWSFMIESRNRYLEYLRNKVFPSSLRFLESYINEFCDHVGRNNNMTIETVKHLLLMGNYIDGVILTSIGELYIE